MAEANLSGLVSALVTIVLIRYVGTIIRFIARLFVKRPRDAVTPDPVKDVQWSRIDRFSSIVLLIVALLPLLHVFNMPYNLIYEIGSRPEEPSFVFREKYQRYMDNVIRTTGVSVDLHQEMDMLYESLRMNENRLLYWTWGHDVYTKCRWCRSDYQYALYTLPVYLLKSAMYLIAFGLSTISSRRSHLRIYAIIIVTVSASMFAALSASPDVTRELFSEWPYPIHDLLAICNDAFMSFFALLMYFSSRPPNAEGQKLRNTAANLKVACDAGQMSQALFQTILYDAHLRQIFTRNSQTLADAINEQLETPTIKSEMTKISQDKAHVQFKNSVFQELSTLFTNLK